LNFQPFQERAGPELLSWIQNETERILWSGSTFDHDFSLPAFNRHLKRKDVFAYSLIDSIQQLVSYGEVVSKIPSSASICRVIVNPELRGRGYGQKFCHELINLIKKKGSAKAISLNTLATNKQAITCYKKVGFQVIRKQRKLRSMQPGNVDIIIMKMSI
jgi:ribosomal protein S18 acetylase RimI-like enzyme